MSDDLNDLYQEVILEHAKSPRNFRELPGANRVAHGRNPLCGDNYTIYLLMDGDVVKEATFQGSGCAISKASASLLRPLQARQAGTQFSVTLRPPRLCGSR